MKPRKELDSPVVDIINLIVIILFATFCIVYIVSPRTGAYKADINKNNTLVQDENYSEDDFFKTDSSHKYTALYIDEKTPNFKYKPYFIQQSSAFDLMVPAFETMSFMGVAVENRGENVITAYKKNVYAKIIGKSDVAYVNGAERALPYKVALKNGVLYCPISFIASAFNYDLKEKNGVVYAKQKAPTEVYSEFAGLYYKSSVIPKLGATISIPEYWQELSKDNYYFGYKEGEEESSLRASSYRLSPKLAGKGIATITSAYIKDNFKASPKISGRSYDEVNGIKYSRFMITNSKNDKTVIYLLLKSSNVYVLNFKGKSPSNVDFFVSSFEYVVSTFRVDSLSLDYDLDHYIEKDLYFKYGIDTQGNIYAGQTAYKSFEFKAKYKDIPKNKSIIAIVEKSGSKSRFPISAYKGALSGRIYLPFGLGSHNIKIVQVDSGISDELTYIQASRDSNIILETCIINTSTNVDTYVVPSYYVDSDDESVINASKNISKNSIKQIDKSRDIFRYMCDEFKLVSSSITNRGSRTLKLKEGTSKELNMLYTALLRSQEIPARISSYRDGGITKFVTEVKINGKWTIVDLTGGIIAHSKERSIQPYFALEHKKFYDNKRNIVQLNY